VPPDGDGECLPADDRPTAAGAVDSWRLRCRGEYEQGVVLVGVQQDLAFELEGRRPVDG